MPKKKDPPALDHESKINGKQEEEKEEQEPPRVPSAVVEPQQQPLLLAHRNLLECIAEMRAVLGVTSESEEEQPESNRTLSAAMVQQRATIARASDRQVALANLQETHDARREAHARLQLWQEHNRRLAH